MRVIALKIATKRQQFLCGQPDYLKTGSVSSLHEEKTLISRHQVFFQQKI
jgi:hypothetical protein